MSDLSDISLVDDLTKLQEQIADRLRSDPFFSDVQVVVENLGDVENLINQAIAEAGGIYVLVMTPAAKVTEPNIPGPFFSQVDVVIRCGELPQINRSELGRNKSANMLAVRVLNRLHHWTDDTRGACLYAIGIEPAPGPENEITFDATLRTSA